jgi:hypothetical protein
MSPQIVIFSLGRQLGDDGGWPITKKLVLELKRLPVSTN